MHLIWLTNMRDPASPGAEEMIAKLPGESSEEAWARHLRYFRGKEIGDPKATAVFTVEQLKAAHEVGVYRKAMTIPEIQAELDLRCGGAGGSLEPAADAEALLLAEGYVRGEAPCSCVDGGEFGHRFVCGWVPQAEGPA